MHDTHSEQEGEVPEIQHEIWMKIYYSREIISEQQLKMHYSPP